MLFYFILLNAIVFTSVCVSFAKDKYFIIVNKVLVFNLLFIPAALRYGIGIDYFDYVEIFDGIPKGLFKGLEPGWRLLNLFIYNLGGNAQVLIAVVAFLTFFFLFCEVDRKKWFIYAPVCMIVLYMYIFTSLRQMLAMSMCFCALQRILKKKYILAIIIAVISYFFHKSAILYIPILFLCYFIRLKPVTTSIVYFIVIVVTNFFSASINVFLFDLIGMGSYAGYLMTDWIKATEPGLGRYIRYFVHILMLLFFPAKNKVEMIILVLFLLYCAIDCYALKLQIIARISRGILFVFMPIMWTVWKFKKNRQVRVTLYIFCFLLLFVRNYMGSEYISLFD